MTTAPVLKIDWEKNGCYGDPPGNNYGVYVCICTVYSSIFKEVTKYTFVYDSHFTEKYKSEFCGAIINNRSYAPICLLEDKDRKIKGALKNVLGEIFFGNCIVEFLFKVTANEYS